MESEAQPEPVAFAKPKRRWSQFSLTTLLVIVTALGITLGVIGRRAEPQRKAVMALRQLGGRVYYSSSAIDDMGNVQDGAPLWPLQWLPRDWVEDVVLIDLRNTAATDSDLLHLRALPEARELLLGGTNTTDAGLSSIQGLTKLEYLWISRTHVSEAGLLKLHTALPNCFIRHDESFGF